MVGISRQDIAQQQKVGSELAFYSLNSQQHFSPPRNLSDDWYWGLSSDMLLNRSRSEHEHPPSSLWTPSRLAMSCLLLARCPLPPHCRWITKGLTWVNAYRSCFLINSKKLPRWLWHVSVLLSTNKSHWPPPPGEMRKTAHDHTAKCEASWAFPSSVLFLTEHSSHCKRGPLGGCHTVKSVQREGLTGFPKRKTERPNRVDVRSAFSYLWSNYICLWRLSGLKEWDYGRNVVSKYPPLEERWTGQRAPGAPALRSLQFLNLTHFSEHSDPLPAHSLHMRSLQLERKASKRREEKLEIILMF